MKLYIIQDESNNSQSNYIDELGNPCHKEVALRLHSEKEAEEFAASLGGNGKWWFIEEIEA